MNDETKLLREWDAGKRLSQDEMEDIILWFRHQLADMTRLRDAAIDLIDGEGGFKSQIAELDRTCRKVHHDDKAAGYAMQQEIERLRVAITSRFESDTLMLQLLYPPPKRGAIQLRWRARVWPCQAVGAAVGFKRSFAEREMISCAHANLSSTKDTDSC